MEIKLSKIAIIAEDPELAEQICSHLRCIGTYLVLFEAPMVRLEGFHVFSNDCIRVSNAVRALRPQIILLVGCQPKVRDELCTYLPRVKTLVMDDFNENELSALQGFRRRQEEANVFRKGSSCFGHVIAIEAEQAMALVIAKNLAIAHSASIYVMPAISEELTEQKNEQLRTWANGDAYIKEEAKRSLIEFIQNQLGPLASSKLDSISFITRGVPYGIYPLSCPATHYYLFPLLGVSVLNGMVKSANPVLRCPLAVLIDPGAVQTSEFTELRQSFQKAG